MPALPPVPGVIKLSFVQIQGTNSNIVTRLYLRYTGSPPTTSTLPNWLSVGELRLQLVHRNPDEEQSR